MEVTRKDGLFTETFLSARASLDNLTSSESSADVAEDLDGYFMDRRSEASSLTSSPNHLSLVLHPSEFTIQRLRPYRSQKWTSFCTVYIRQLKTVSVCAFGKPAEDATCIKLTAKCTWFLTAPLQSAMFFCRRVHGWSDLCVALPDEWVRQRRLPLPTPRLPSCQIQQGV